MKLVEYIVKKYFCWRIEYVGFTQFEALNLNNLTVQNKIGTAGKLKYSIQLVPTCEYKRKFIRSYDEKYLILSFYEKKKLQNMKRKLITSM